MSGLFDNVELLMVAMWAMGILTGWSVRGLLQRRRRV
jgi:hypothetical protein